MLNEKQGYNTITIQGGSIMEFASSLGIIVTVVAMILCPIIAHNTGRSAFGWFFGGLLLGGIGIIIVSCLSSKH